MTLLRRLGATFFTLCYFRQCSFPMDRGGNITDEKCAIQAEALGEVEAEVKEKRTTNNLNEVAQKDDDFVLEDVQPNIRNDLNLISTSFCSLERVASGLKDPERSSLLRRAKRRMLLHALKGL